MKTIAPFALVVLLAGACSSRNESTTVELEKTATQAMAELNTADDAFPGQITGALGKLGADLLIEPARAADTVKTTILPLVDGYLATIDRAVATADAYLATRNDDESRQALDVIRKRAESFRKARERFAELEQKARSGASAEELNQAIMHLSLMLGLGK